MDHTIEPVTSSIVAFNHQTVATCRYDDGGSFCYTHNSYTNKPTDDWRYSQVIYSLAAECANCGGCIESQDATNWLHV